MEPEPERSLAKRESRREAKDEEGSDGSKAAVLFFMSEDVTDSALGLCVFDVDGTLGTGDETGYVDDGDKDDEDGGNGERQDGEDGIVSAVKKSAWAWRS